MKGAKVESKENGYPVTIGFWRQGARFNSSTLKKNLMPKGSYRIQVIKNSYKKTRTQPDYIGYLVEAGDEDSLNIERPLSVLRETARIGRIDSEEIASICNDINGLLDSVFDDLYYVSIDYDDEADGNLCSAKNSLGKIRKSLERIGKLIAESM